MPIPDPVLSDVERVFLADARRAVLGTIAGDGRPRLMPICFVLDTARPVLWTPLDEKPKTVDNVTRLARVRDIRADPRVTVLVDRWDEDWTQLAWLRCYGAASIMSESEAPGREAAVAALRTKYKQYEAHALGSRPMIRIDIVRTTSWGVVGGP